MTLAASNPEAHCEDLKPQGESLESLEPCEQSAEDQNSARATAFATLITDCTACPVYLVGIRPKPHGKISTSKLPSPLDGFGDVLGVL